MVLQYIAITGRLQFRPRGRGDGLMDAAGGGAPLKADESSRGVELPSVLGEPVPVAGEPLFGALPGPQNSRQLCRF